MKELFKEGFSLNEFKVSALIIVFVVLSVVAVYSYLKHGDVSPNFVTLLNTNAVTVGGVNALKVVTDVASSSYRRKNQNDQNNDANQDNQGN